MAFINQVVPSILFILAAVSSRIIEKEYESNDHEWDHIVYAQQWPESACQYENSTGRHTCEIPSQTKTWTVHGLWPSLGDSRGPSYCNDSWGFDASKIESILPQMKSNWPNLFTDTELTSFWKHEWEKHGTCAASLDSLRGELKYFSTGLSLNKKYDILGVLSRRGISPSRTREYGMEDIIGILQDEFGHQACIGCTYSEDIGQLLYQTYICLDKGLSIIDCPSCSRSCRSGENLAYYPIQNNFIY